MIRFPTSGAPDAQPHFLQGVRWLHSFEYEEAIEAFRKAQTLDPAFAMAYWGEAMAYDQRLWQRQDVGAAREALLRLAPTRAARAAKAPTPRERGYFDAVEILFGEGDKCSRDRAYADAMRRLATRFPDDHEAASFYALALLGMTARGLAGLADEDDHRHALAGSETQQQVAAILQTVLNANPDHPGAAHYLIHTYDDPDHAQLALPIARRYAGIAPAASHALHMPAHIFLQLGLWDEAAASDEAAYAASDRWVKRKKLPIGMRSYHSLAWLEYEALQQGRYRKAEETLNIITQAIAESGLPLLKGIHASMRGRYGVETARWHAVRGQQKYGNADELFAIGLSGARSGNLQLAALAKERLAALAVAEKTGDRKPIVAIMEKELAAVLALASGRAPEAVALLEVATSMEDRLPAPLGPPLPIKPSHELFGELLLELGRPREAIAQFDRSLKRAANRSASVLGLARAASRLGDEARARTSYARFLDNWRLADRELPELAEAQAGARASGCFIPDRR